MTKRKKRIARRNYMINWSFGVFMLLAGVFLVTVSTLHEIWGGTVIGVIITVIAVIFMVWLARNKPTTKGIR